jgi:hypothetical protein
MEMREAASGAWTTALVMPRFRTRATRGAEYFCRRHVPEYLHNDMVSALVRRAELRDIRLAKRLMEAGLVPSSAPKFLFGGLIR